MSQGPISTPTTSHSQAHEGHVENLNLTFFSRKEMNVIWFFVLHDAGILLDRARCWSFLPDVIRPLPFTTYIHGGQFICQREVMIHES